MKEATGELNMTVVTVIAIVAIGLLFYVVVWPMVQGMIVQQTCNTYGMDYVATRIKESIAEAGSAKVGDWVCCKKDASGEADRNNCIKVKTQEESSEEG